MPFCRVLIQLTKAAFLAALVFPAWAGAKVELRTGLEYDSNVAPDSLESNADKGDYARELKLGLGYEQRTQRLTAMALYQFEDSRWQSYSDYDSQMHIGLGRLAYQGTEYSADISLAQAYSQVAGREFLQLSRASPALGKLFNSRWYGRAQLDISRKTFADYSARDSDSLAGSLYLYHFIERTRFYLSGQVQFKNERATQDIYSHQAWTTQLQLKKRWVLFDRDFDLRLKGRIEQRDYQGERSDIQARRQDIRLRAALEGSWQLGLGFALTGELRQDWFHSNVQAADYDQYRASLGIEWGF